ncbi:hypothetical protein [Stenotrophomonas phage RAS14]
MTTNTAPKKTKIALNLTVDQDEYLAAFSDIGAQLVTSHPTFFNNFKQFIADHYEHTTYIQHPRLVHLSDSEEVIDGVNTRVSHDAIDLRCSSMLVSGTRKIYDITLYATLSPNDEQEFLLPLPMDLVRCGTADHVKQLMDANHALTTTLSDTEQKEFDELNPNFDQYKGLTLAENDQIVAILIDFLLDTTDLADHMDA